MPAPTPSATTPRHPYFPVPFEPGGFPEQRLELGERIRQERRVAASLDGKADGPVERRHLLRPESLRLPFPEPEPGHPLPILEFVIHWGRVTSYPHHIR